MQRWANLPRWHSARLSGGGSGVCFHFIMLVFKSSGKESFFSPLLGNSLFTKTAVKDILIFAMNITCAVSFVFEARSRPSIKLVVITEFPEYAGGGGSFLSCSHGILMQNEDLPSCRYRLSLSNQRCPNSCKIAEQELDERKREAKNEKCLQSSDWGHRVQRASLEHPPSNGELMLGKHINLKLSHKKVHGLLSYFCEACLAFASLSITLSLKNWKHSLAPHFYFGEKRNQTSLG